MCFSAPVSFVAAIGLGGAGFYSIRKAKGIGELPLACFPLLFGVQQFCEGVLWLLLSHGVMTSSLCLSFFTYGFVSFAEILWPILAPLAVLLVENNKYRRLIMNIFVALGCLCGLYLLWMVISGSVMAQIQGFHLVYLFEAHSFSFVRYVYLAVTILPFLFASDRILISFGILLGVAYGISIVMADYAYVSVWCFFAAVLSSVLCFYFYRRAKE